jgi:hypothetical protein
MKKIMASTVLALCSFYAQAGFVHSDYLVASDERATLHEETGLEWLKMSETNYLSLADVRNELGPGGNFEGWRLPTQNEVDTFVRSFFSDFDFDANSNYSFTYDGVNEASKQADEFVTYSGVAREHSIYRWAFGFSEDESGKVSLSGFYKNGSTGYAYSRFSHSAYSETYKSNGQGIFLVSDGGLTLSSQADPSRNINNPDAPVNSVPAMAIGGLALIGMGLRRKSRVI